MSNRHVTRHGMLAIAAFVTLPLSPQRFYPQADPQALPKVRQFLARFDPGNYYFPGEVATRNGVQAVRQPPRESCSRNPEIDAMEPFTRSMDLTSAERGMISTALEGSLVCSPTFAGAFNAFGRVPSGPTLTSLRQILGRGVRVVDWRYANAEERQACTNEISRPSPRFHAVFTMERGFVQTVDVAYDVGINGVVANVRDRTAGNTFGNNISNAITEAQQAAKDSKFQNPSLNGQQLYCLNVEERMTKIYDGDGRVTGTRSYRSSSW